MENKYYEITFTLIDGTELKTYGDDVNKEFDALVERRANEGLETLPWKKSNKVEIFG